MTISTSISRDRVRTATAHFRNAEGFLSVNAAQVFLLLDQIQRGPLQSWGHILEVGAHEARSSVFFTHLLGPSETLHVSDLFDYQALNVSRSAGSTYARWEQNFNRFKFGNPKVEVHRGRSQEIEPTELGNDFRLAYLDGGHATEEVISDLKLADSILVEEGAAVLDDTFNQEFPGTTEGLIDFLRSDESRLVPILCFETKVALVRKSHAETYLSSLKEMLNTGESWFLPGQLLSGHEVLIIRFYNGPLEQAGNWIKESFPRIYSRLGSSHLAQTLFHRARQLVSGRK